MKLTIYFIAFYLTGLVLGFACGIKFMNDRAKRSKKAILTIFVIPGIWLLAGCSWQGQKYQTYILPDETFVVNNQPVINNTDKILVINDEWWSMRFFWVSNGVEAYTKTDHYKTGSNIAKSYSDPNTVDLLNKIMDLVK